MFRADGAEHRSSPLLLLSPSGLWLSDTHLSGGRSEAHAHYHLKHVTGLYESIVYILVYTALYWSILVYTGL